MSDPGPETDPDFWPHALTRLVRREDLDADEAAEAMRQIMAGEATPGQVGGFLMALRTKGESADEVEGLARTMLGFANPVQTPAPAVDVVGTGGDRSGTFNISTVSAIVAAGAGVLVAKHGNRAASSHCGSADVLEALGVTIDLDAAGAERCLAEAGIAFLFAPMFHPAMAHAGPVRRELRVPTVFNFLGPLTNPARPFAQAVGCSDARMLPLMAEVLARRGTRAVLFRGEDGLDELTTSGPSTVYTVRGGSVTEGRLDPTALGFAPATVDDLRGGDADASAAIVRWVLAGEVGPKRDVVLLNAGAALEVAGRAQTLADGIELAAETIDSGAATAALDRWVEVSGNG
ncbi:MAG TPA: anthranilate phosphoribosyltransferase [Actinomycetota bacterium]|nr:anthranilate phosphoribosyltransferase [Actinomycetota bacterium]